MHTHPHSRVPVTFEDESWKRTVYVSLTAALFFGTACITTIAGCAYWNGSARWILFGIDCVFLVVSGGITLQALATGTTHTHSLASVLGILSSVLNLFTLPSVPTILYTVLAAVVATTVYRSRIVHVIRWGAALVFLVFAVIFGLDKDIFPHYQRDGEPRAVRVVWSLLCGWLAPMVIVGSVFQIENRLAFKRRKIDEALAILAERQAQLEEEERLSRRLLHNILPKEVASVCLDLLRKEVEAEARPNGRVPVPESFDKIDEDNTPMLPNQCPLRPPRPAQFIVARAHASGTVVFADICGFTVLSSKCDAVSLVAALNSVFTEMDRECVARKVEKIKTIGDCYMACALANPKHDATTCAERVVMLAQAMHSIVRNKQISGTTIQVRAGANSGPLVSGVIGLTKLCYDLWGDTVNVASRMESSGVPGRTHISEATHELLTARPTPFRFEARGRTEVKGKGPMETYLVVPGSYEPVQRLHGSSRLHAGAGSGASCPPYMSPSFSN